MKKTVLAGAVTLALGFAGAAGAQAYGDVARVVSATPIVERVTVPRRDCRVEQVSGYEERRIAGDGYRRAGNDGIGPGAILGAIVGGVIGHQFGNSTGGRDHGTAAGAIVGGLIGNSVERDAQAATPSDGMVERTPVTREVQRCQDAPDSRERVVGYDVRYEYNGREFRTRMPYDPGTEMPVNVEVRPPVARALPPSYRGPY